ncbi:MAG: bifunctional diguanylate cyclase/phosphodiesterase [Neomegalonema sp.]|nr:bifunctional diguanylate cyclase/phosphodiesterase [Neomegalonema sp.]
MMTHSPRQPDPALEAQKLKKRLERERLARKTAEQLLDEKSRELYLANEQLGAANSELAESLRDAQIATEENRRLAQVDALTGLANRRRLFVWLDSTLRQLINCRHRTLGVLHIDLDRFKQVNDTLGHAAGDSIMREAARRLAEIAASRPSNGLSDSACGREAIAARLGGDEFVLAGVANGGIRAARRVFAAWGAEIVGALREVATGDGLRTRLGASVGIALREQSRAPTTSSDLLAQADLALRQSKTQGGGQTSFFDRSLRRAANARHRLRNGLMSAMERKEFVPVYQPQVDARTRQIVGAEALVRWRRSSGRMIGPDEFISFAAELGMLPAIDKAICNRAMTDLRAWRDAGLILPKLSVNVSAGRLADPDLLDGLAPEGAREGLTFELLESMVLDDLPPEVGRTLTSIADAGINIEIDDFGSGHASIVALMRLRPGRIKLDRALISTILECPDHRNVVASIIQMAHGLNVKVTAEGVEKTAQADMLTEMGCDTLQGFLFSRPLRSAHFSDLLAAPTA